jgi:glycogen debranching enzyme
MVRFERSSPTLNLTVAVDACQEPEPNRYLRSVPTSFGGAVSEPAHAPLQPWLHALAISVDGHLTVLGRQDGQLTGDGAEGLFVDDARVLSVLEVLLDGRAPAFVGAAARGSAADFLGSARGLGDHGPDPSIEVLRHRRLARGVMTEEVVVRSRAAADVSARVSLRLGGDGAEVSDVKHGVADTRLCDAVVEASVARWSTPRHEVVVRLEGFAEVRPHSDGGVVADVDVDIAPGGVVRLAIEVTAARTAESLFDAEAASSRVSWEDDIVVECPDRRLSSLVRGSIADFQHLLLDDPANRDDFFVAAGTPWYLTLFGRDSLWSARLTLPLGTELAAGTLRALARRQGTEVAVGRAEAPGKIAHELRRIDFVDKVHHMHLPPVYYGTVDATALWVCTLHDAWRWGMPVPEVEALLPALRSALHWVTEVAPGDDGLLRYVDETGTGLANQGWKDSGDSIRWRDGQVAEAPIALVEAQAYAVEAARGAVALFEALGTEGDRADIPRLRAFADTLTIAIRQRYWVRGEAHPYLAMALDGRGEAVTGVGSNMGHVLGTGALTAEEAARVVRVLTGPTLLLDGGIATLATDNGGFNPLGYHTGSVWTHDTAICALGLAREGFTSEAVDVALRLVRTGSAFGDRFPELFADGVVLGGPAPYPASCRPQAWAAASAVAILRIALGLEVDAPARTVTVRPPKPLAFGQIRVAGLSVAGSPVTIHAADDGSVTVDGLPDDWRLLT